MGSGYTRHPSVTGNVDATDTFALCCHSNATRAPIANPRNSAQLGGIPYHSPKFYQGPCNSVGMRPRTDRQTHTQTRVTTIHFASSTTHAKCNNYTSLKLAQQTCEKLRQCSESSITQLHKIDTYAIEHNKIQRKTIEVLVQQ